MGGPSAAIVLAELIALGAEQRDPRGHLRRAGGRAALGELVIAREAICADGTSRALGAGERAGADPLADRRAGAPGALRARRARS